MSKTPVSTSTTANPQEAVRLVATLEKSLEVDFLRGGTNAARLDYYWTTQPFTLVGQSPEGPIAMDVGERSHSTLPAGAGYIVPEGVRYRPVGTDTQIRLYHWAHLRLRVLGEVDLFHFIESPGIIPPAQGKEIGRLNRALARTALPDDKPLIQAIAERRRLCSELLSLIVRVSTPRPGAWQTFALISRLLPVLRFMRDQIGRPVLQDELTRLAGLSPSRFHALFHAATGLPPQQYLMNLRLRTAQEQLISTQLPINEVAHAVGFRDPFHFSRMFKRASGLSPRAYRQQMIRSISASG